MSGLGAFIRGAFEGKNIRDGWDDRKRRQKSEDVQAERATEAFDWQREDREYLKGERSFERSERARAITERDAERAAWNAYADEAFAGDTAPPAGEAAPAPSRAMGIMPDVVGQTALSYGRTAAPDPVTQDPRLVVSSKSAPTAPVAAPSPTSRELGVLGYGTAKDADLDPNPGGTSFQQKVASAKAETDRLLAATDPAAPAGVTMDQWRAMSFAERKAQGLPASEMGANVYFNGLQPGLAPPERPKTQLWGQNLATDARNVGISIMDAGSAAGNTARSVINENVEDSARRAVGYAGAINSGLDYLTSGTVQIPGKDSPYVPAQRPNEAAAKPVAAPLKPTGDQKPAQAGAAAKREALSFGTAGASAATPDGTPLASADIVARMPGFSVIGPDMPVKTTKAATERAANGGVAAYRSEKVPALIEHYIRAGQPEKAAAFQKYIDDNQTKEGMKGWMKAIHSFSVNDAEGLKAGLITAYDSYYDDGLTVVADQTEIITNQGTGEILGAKITFQDKATGEEFTQIIDNVTDLAAVGIGMLAPEAAFDAMWNMTLGKKSADPVSKPTAKNITDAIASRALTDPVFGALPYEQQFAEMQRVMTGAGGGAPMAEDDLPIYE